MAFIRLRNGVPQARCKIPRRLGAGEVVFSLRKLNPALHGAFLARLTGIVSVLDKKARLEHLKGGQQSMSLQLNGTRAVQQWGLAELIRFEAEDMVEGLVSDPMELVDQLMEVARGVALDLATPGLVKDMEQRAQLHMESQVNMAEAKALQGDWRDFRALRDELAAPVLAAGAPRQGAEESEEVPTVGEAVECFLLEKRSGTLAPKTVQDYCSFFPLLAEGLGSTTLINTVRRQDLLTWRDTALAGASHATLCKRLGLVSSFFKWVDETQDIRGFKNPAVRLIPQQGKATKQAHEERERWSDAELSKLVALDDWLITLGAFTGARLNELAQLHKDDVLIDDQGRVSLRIDQTHPDQRLKTAAAARVVPLGFPSGLLNRFLRYLNSFDHERIFPKLTFRANYQSYSNSAGKAVTPLLRKLSPTKTFHGLRHAFADRCKQLGVPDGMIKELIGHQQDDITLGRYGKRYDVGVLREALEKAGVWEFC